MTRLRHLTRRHIRIITMAYLTMLITLPALANSPPKVSAALPPVMTQLNNKLQASKVVDLTYFSSSSLNKTNGAQKLPIAMLALNDLISPVLVINVQNQVNQHANYSVTSSDVLSFEKNNGQIPPNSIVIINTGWFKQHKNKPQYLSLSKAHPKQFPSISQAALQLLYSRNITAIGIDAPDQNAVTPDATTTVERKQKNQLIIYNLNNLDYLPIKGSTLILGVLPTQTSHAAARVFALLP